MRAFLQLLNEHGCPRLEPDDFRRRVGEPAWDVLRAAGVLVDLPPATTYRCGEGEACRREVLHEPSERFPERPYEAICGSTDDLWCPTVRLSAADLSFVGVSVEAFATRLARLRGVADPIPREHPDLPGVHVLGHDPNGRALAFTTRARLQSARLFLCTAPRRATLLAPARARTPAELVERHAPGERVELRFLEDELVLRAGRLALTAAQSEVAAAVPMRRVIDQDGERDLDDLEYERLRAERRAFDLFVDLSALLGPNRVEVLAREPDGKQRDASISLTQARALVELARHRGPMRPRAIRAFSEALIQAPKRRIELMRRAIDTRVGHRRWRFINTISGGTTTFEFAPASGTSFAIVLGQGATTAGAAA